MNTKFKLPKFGRNLTGGNMLKELLLTTLATTISIVLTFGTAAWIEHRQKEKNRKQTTMMVLCDIYVFEKQLEQYDSVYVSNWKDALEKLQTLSHDSIMNLTDEDQEKCWNALATPLMLPHDKTAENIFTSDVSTWREVGNFRFIKLVSFIYTYINDIVRNFDVQIERKTNNYQAFTTDASQSKMSNAELLIKFIEQKEVQHFMLDFSKGYHPYFQSSIKYLDAYLKQCMEMMNVSEEDLKEFIDNNL